MKIYVTHSKDFDYSRKLYEPLKASPLAAEHEFILPYEHGTPRYSSKDDIRRCALMIAEISKPSTGSGIEIGWADNYTVPIAAFYEYGSDYSRSVEFVAKETVSYSGPEELLTKIADAIKRYA